MWPIDPSKGRSRRGSALVLLASLLVGCLLLAHGGSAHAQAASAPLCPAPPPTATPVGPVSPSEVVVCVHTLPITLATFTHWSEVARKSGGGLASAKGLAEEVLGFLIYSGQTPADVMFRVKLNLLSRRIQARVLAAHHGARAKQRALARWVGGFKRRWRSRTYCTPEYAVVECGHVVGPPL